MSLHQPFFPTYGAGVTLAATAASATSTFRKGNKQMRLVNIGPNNAHVRIASAENIAAATTADFTLPVTTGTIQAYIISIPESADSIAVISPGGTATVYAQPGEGF